MATNGSFNSSTAQTQFFGSFYLATSWSLESQNAATNTSKIAWKVTVHSSAGQPCGFTSGYLKIDGTTVAQVGAGLVANGATVAEGTTTLSHAANGTKSFSMEVYGDLTVSVIGNIGTTSGSASFELPYIPRGSEITSVSDVNIGSACSVKWTPESSAYKYKLKFTMGSFSGETDFVSPAKTSAYTYTGYTIPLNAAEQIPNSKTGTMSVVLTTYTADGTNIGTSAAASFKVTCPSSMAPSVAMVVSPVNSMAVYTDRSSIYIQGKSRVQANLSGSSAKYKATIASCVFYVGTTKYETANLVGTSEIVGTSGTIQIKGVVTDSRGFTSEVAQNISVLAYGVPAVIPYSGNKVVCERTPDNKLKIEAGRQYSKLAINGTQYNFCSLAYRYAESGASFSAWNVLLSESSSSDKISTVAGVTLNEKKTYTVELKAEDELGGIKVLSFAISTGEATFHLKPGGKGAAFGKYAEQDNLLDVEWDASFHKGINGVYIRKIDLSTNKFTLSMSKAPQSVLLFGSGVFGTLSYNGTSTGWNGTGSVSCSTNGAIVEVTVPSTETFVAISGNAFEISA